MPPKSKKCNDYYRDRRRRKVCSFCADKTVVIDYKEVNRLRRYLSERAKIEPRRKTGTCAAHQRELAIALKRARHVALLPYAPSTSAPDPATAAASPAGAAARPPGDGRADPRRRRRRAPGVFGSLLGLGGGMLIVPLLTLASGCPCARRSGSPRLP